MNKADLLKERNKMGTKDKEEERRFILECIRLYEKLPALWNTKWKDYSNRDIKNRQYEVLLRKYKQRYPRADKIDLIKKFNSLRTNFRKEIKKLDDSKSSGHREEPTLWYFDEMKFLLKDQSCVCQANIPYEPDFKKIQAIKKTETELKPKRCKSNSPADDLVRLATKRLKSSQDSCQQIANVWANKLSEMDRDQRLFAEKVINEVVFNGELGLLNYSTTLTNLSSIRMRNYLLINRNKTITDASDSSQESHLTDYASNYCQISNDGLTDQESIHSTENYIVGDYDPLYDSVKLED